MTAVPDSTDRDPPAQLAADRHCRRQKMLALRPNSRQPQLSLPQSTTLSSSPLQALSFPTTSWSCGTTGPTQAYKLHHRAPCWLHFVHLRRLFTSLSPLMCLPSSTLSSPTSMEPHCVADARFPSSARVRCRARSFDSGLGHGSWSDPTHLLDRLGSIWLDSLLAIFLSFLGSPRYIF